MALSDGGIALNGLEVNDFTPIWLQDFDLGAETVGTSDIDSPSFDDTFPGVDFFRAPTWAFTIVVEGSTAAEVHDRVGLVKAAWREQRTAKRGGALSELRVRLAGRERVVFGRPRRFATTAARTAHQGYAVIDCDFKLMDPLVYEAGWQLEKLVIPASDGSTFPTVVGEIADTGGVEPAPFLVDISARDGSLVNPHITIDSERYEFELTLAVGERIRIDSRAGTAVRANSNYSVLPNMKKPVRLKTKRLAAGSRIELQFGGRDTTGTAEAEVWWRPAHYTV